MPKLDPFQLNRPETKKATKTFTDPANPGKELTLTLRSLDDAESQLAFEEAQTFYFIYCGDPENRVPAQRPFPPVKGRGVALSKYLFRNAAVLCRMQDGDSADHYNVEQMIALMVTMPTAMKEVMSWTHEIDPVVTEKNDLQDGQES
jgi:hypothetical protein